MIMMFYAFRLPPLHHLPLWHIVTVRLGRVQLYSGSRVRPNTDDWRSQLQLKVIFQSLVTVTSARGSQTPNLISMMMTHLQIAFTST